MNFVDKSHAWSQQLLVTESRLFILDACFIMMIVLFQGLALGLLRICIMFFFIKQMVFFLDVVWWNLNAGLGPDSCFIVFCDNCLQSKLSSEFVHPVLSACSCSNGLSVVWGFFPVPSLMDDTHTHAYSRKKIECSITNYLSLSEGYFDSKKLHTVFLMIWL